MPIPSSLTLIVMELPEDLLIESWMLPEQSEYFIAFESRLFKFESSI